MNEYRDVLKKMLATELPKDEYEANKIIDSILPYIDTLSPSAETAILDVRNEGTKEFVIMSRIEKLTNVRFSLRAFLLETAKMISGIVFSGHDLQRVLAIWTFVEKVQMLKSIQLSTDVAYVLLAIAKLTSDQSSVTVDSILNVLSAYGLNVQNVPACIAELEKYGCIYLHDDHIDVVDRILILKA